MHQVPQPPFSNDDNYMNQIETKLERNRRFPFVQLRSLVEEYSQHLATLTSNDHKKVQSNAAAANKSDGLDFKCHICSKVFDRQIQLTYHLGYRHPEVEKPFPCSECSETFQNFQDRNLHLGTKHSNKFKLHRKAGRIFAYVLKCECPHCPMKFIATSLLTKHSVVHKNNSPYVCDVCGLKYRHLSTLQNHKNSTKCQPVLKGSFKCDKCNTLATSEEQLISHKSICHGPTPIKTKKHPLICLFCGYKAKDVYKLERHNRCHTKPFQCEACDKYFLSQTNLNAHIRLGCAETKVIELKDTSPTTNTETDIRDDKLNEIAEKLIPMEGQQGSLELMEQMTNFIQSEEEDEVKFDVSFPVDPLTLPTNPVQLDTFTHVKIRTNKCPHCQRKFRNRSQLLMHSVVHSKNKFCLQKLKKKCTQVVLQKPSPETQSTKLGSKDHKTTSTKSKQLTLKCHLCSKTFHHPVQLTHHRKFHHPEVKNPFPCSICTASYGTVKELNLHLGTKHPDQFDLKKRGNSAFALIKKYQCPHCPKKFSIPYRLNRHAAIHLNEFPYVCEACGSKFKIADPFNRHKKSMKKCQSILKARLVQLPSRSEEEDEIKAKVSFSVNPLVHSLAQNEMNTASIAYISEKDSDPISSWIQSVTNNTVVLQSDSDFFSGDVIPTTVLKMEHH